MSIFEPPMRDKTRLDTCSSVRRTMRGGVGIPASTAPDPMAVGTHPGYRTWRWTPLCSASNAMLSVKALRAAFEAP